MNYRKLTTEEIKNLESQNCTADDWANISVHPEFITANVINVNFSGEIKIGLLKGEFELSGGFIKKSVLKNAYIHNCVIGDNVHIENVHNYLANYVIDDNTYIQNINYLYVKGETSFGNGTEVMVLNESGGREVVIYDNLSAHFAYIMTFYRHRPKLIKKMQEIVERYTKSVTSAMGYIGKNVKIANVSAIKNVKIGDCTTIEGASLLEDGTINSNAVAPVHIGYGVVANDFIISSGTRITDGVMLTRCFIRQEILSFLAIVKEKMVKHVLFSQDLIL